MGTRRLAGNGNIANSGARIVLGNFATRLRVRLSPGGGCLLDRVSALRLARSLCRRRAPGGPCALHPCGCAWIACVVTAAARDRLFLEACLFCAQTPRGAFSLRDFADYGV